MFMHNPWRCWEKITFDQSFVFKHKISSFEKCCLEKKKKVKGCGDISKILCNVKQISCDMAVIAYRHPMSFRGKGMTV